MQTFYSFVKIVLLFLRSRLKKDYDDFKRHPDHDKFTRELWNNDESEVDSGKDSFTVACGKSSESAEHVEVHGNELQGNGKHLLEFDSLNVIQELDFFHVSFHHTLYLNYYGDKIEIACGVCLRGVDWKRADCDENSV